MLITNIPNHQKVKLLTDVDYIGSSIALWGTSESELKFHHKKQPTI
jgi:hypothetical protein